MKKTLFFLSLFLVMVAFTQSTPEHPLVVTLYGQMILYQNCQNLVGTSIPTLGKDYKPAFKTDNGTLVPKANLGEFDINPSKLGTCTISISSRGKDVGDWTFTVFPTPAPSAFLATTAGAETTIAEPVKKGSYFMALRPEANFLNTLPRECNYRVNEINLNIFRRGKNISTKTYTNKKMPFDLNDTQAGDMVQIIVTKAQRINSRGQLFDAMPTNPIINFMVKEKE